MASGSAPKTGDKRLDTVLGLAQSPETVGKMGANLTGSVTNLATGDFKDAANNAKQFAGSTSDVLKNALIGNAIAAHENTKEAINDFKNGNIVGGVFNSGEAVLNAGLQAVSFVPGLGTTTKVVTSLAPMLASGAVSATDGILHNRDKKNDVISVTPSKDGIPGNALVTKRNGKVVTASQYAQDHDKRGKELEQMLNADLDGNGKVGKTEINATKIFNNSNNIGAGATVVDNQGQQWQAKDFVNHNPKAGFAIETANSTDYNGDGYIGEVEAGVLAKSVSSAKKIANSSNTNAQYSQDQWLKNSNTSAQLEDTRNRAKQFSDAKETFAGSISPSGMQVPVPKTIVGTADRLESKRETKDNNGLLLNTPGSTGRNFAGSISPSGMQVPVPKTIVGTADRLESKQKPTYGGSLPNKTSGYPINLGGAAINSTPVAAPKTPKFSGGTNGMKYL